VTKRVESEGDLIETYLVPLAKAFSGAFDLQDDAALLTVPAGHDLVVTSDPVVSGVHFFADDRPEDIAWKALAVNMSDLAAKGAKPLAYMLTLALPEAPEVDWIKSFAAGLEEAQQAFGCHLAGGDTDRTPGPLAIGITAMGIVKTGTFVKRRSAEAGDHVFVTGTLGDAALGLALRRDRSHFGPRLADDARDFLIRRYLRPEPRLALRHSLQRYASAALDISDGFLKDLRRLAGTNGIEVVFAELPASNAAQNVMDVNQAAAIDAILGGGGDYELLAAVPERSAEAFASDAARTGIEVKDIGVLRPHTGIMVVGDTGTAVEAKRSGYDHLEGQR
jgi:thiamine-monophosphate kinase